MPTRMTFRGLWPLRKPPPVPVVVAETDPRDIELRRLRVEVSQLRREAGERTAQLDLYRDENRTLRENNRQLWEGVERVADTAAAALAREQVAAQNVARNLDAVVFGVEQKLELALGIMIPEQVQIYEGELTLRGGAGVAGPNIQEGGSPKKYLAYQEHIRSARSRRKAY